MGITTISLAGYEADDLLGTLAKRSEEKGMDVTVLSGDRDLLQLAPPGRSPGLRRWP